MKRLVASLLLAVSPALAQDARKSGFDFMSKSNQAMQTDDAANPGMFWVLEGAALWARPEGAEGTACSSCHGEAEASMKGVAARYPAYDAGSRRVVDLSGRVNLCRVGKQKAAPLAHESRALLAVTAFLGMQSRSMALAPPQGPEMDAARQRGSALYTQRMGQLDLACAQCHEDNWGRSLGGATIPQGHANNYPAYRLEWQTMGSLQRRLRNCLSGVRAEAFEFGAQELVDLEAFLAERAAGLPVETPSVRP